MSAPAIPGALAKRCVDLEAAIRAMLADLHPASDPEVNGSAERARVVLDIPTLPAGYALVPIEPTEAMLKQAKRWLCEDAKWFPGAWKAIIAAASPSPSDGGER